MQRMNRRWMPHNASDGRHSGECEIFFAAAGMRERGFTPALLTFW